jgi:NarL family two-component system sensor histidine kinase LiaS
MLVATAEKTLESNASPVASMEIMNTPGSTNQFERQIASISRFECSRISRQLHDGLSQQLAAMAMLVESLKQRLANEGSPQAQMANRILSAIEEAKQQARELSNLVTPIAATGDNIVAALRELAQQSCGANMRCTFKCRGSAPRIDGFTAEQLVHFARDAVSFLRHRRQPSHVSVKLTTGAGTALEIRGDCLAGAPSSDRSDENLHILHIRARLIGGELSIQSSGREGTVITCTVPSISSTSTSDRNITVRV